MEIPLAAERKAFFRPSESCVKETGSRHQIFPLEYLGRFCGTVIVLALGWIIARFADSFLQRLLEKHKMDVTVSKFILSIVKILIMAFAALIALGKFGITIAPFIGQLERSRFWCKLCLAGPAF